MSQGYQTATSTVIVFELEPSLRRLITLGLQHQGLHVIEATSLHALDEADIEAADLLVMDVDNKFVCDWPLINEVQQHPQLAMLPSVVLSWDTSSVASAQSKQSLAFLPKPFDARAMYQKIAELLTIRTTEKKAAIANAEALLLASYQRPSPSIWPLITAIGMLCIVIGLLFQILVTVLGVMIVAAGLLLWTLGAQQRSGKSDAFCSPGTA